MVENLELSAMMRQASHIGPQRLPMREAVVVVAVRLTRRHFLR